MSEIKAYAQCLQQECDQVGVCHEITMIETRTQQRSPDMPALIISEAVHRHLEDDSDATCPSCGFARALLENMPREIPKMLA
jgi:hypothetical protein